MRCQPPPEPLRHSVRTGRPVPKTCPRLAIPLFSLRRRSWRRPIQAVSAHTLRAGLSRPSGAGRCSAGSALRAICREFPGFFSFDPKPLLNREGLDFPQNRPFCRYLSPLPDSNRGPPPYHGGFGLRLCDAGKALCSALSLQVGWFISSLHPSLEGPSASPEILGPVPRTYPQRSPCSQSAMGMGESRRAAGSGVRRLFWFVPHQAARLSLRADDVREAGGHLQR